jgi:hypothetical protein
MAPHEAKAIRFPRTMSAQDMLFWSMGKDPTLRSTTCAVALLDRAPDHARLVGTFRKACDEIPRLRQRVVEFPMMISAPVWSFDPHFDLDYHLRWIGAPRDGSVEAVIDLAAMHAMQNFDLTRPLWEITVVEGLQDGSAALIQKLHH